MNNKQYFYQYESPNIVIVPTMSCNPPSPKRRKIGNNIIVPIVTNAVCEKLTSAQEKNPQDDANKKVDENKSSSKSATQKSSWAANYLQSIGLDKKSSIWNRKIPRKTSSQKCVSFIEPPKNTSEPTTSSSYVPKIDIEKNIQKNIVADSNTLKDSNTEMKHLKELKNLSINEKSKRSKSNHETQKHAVVKNPSDVKNNKTYNISTCNNKNIFNDLNKIKTDKIKKNNSHDQPFDLCTSGGHSSHTKSTKVINEPSQKDIKSKLPSNHPPVRHRPKSENRVEKSNIKSVVIKEVQDNKKCHIKTKQTKRDSAKEMTNSSSNYKEKHKHSKYTMEKISPKSPIKNIKGTKKCDKVEDFNKADVLRKAQNNTDHKCKAIHNKTNTGNKTKTKKKSSNIILDKKINKSPVKIKTSKTKNYRKIKLVINLICNKNPSPVKCNESSNNENNSAPKTCTVSNVDLDFLNDFNIDEIVESLDTCEKNESQNKLSNQGLNIGKTDKHSISNVQNFYTPNNDAIDLIKTLKGEEDDDLMRISTENAKELLFRNVANNNTQGNDNSQIKENNVSKSRNSTISNDFSIELIKTEGKEEKEKLEPIATVSSNASNNEVTIDKNVSPVDIENTCCNTNKSEKGKDTNQTLMKINAEDSKHDCSQSSTENVKIVTLRNLSIELDDNKNESNKEQNINPFISEIGSLTVNSDSCETPTLDDVVKESINQQNIKWHNIHTNRFINSDKPLVQQNVEKKIYKDQNKNETLLNHKPQKNANTGNVNQIVDTENSSNLFISNIRQPDMNTSTNEIIQNKETDQDIKQQKLEKPDNQYSNLASKQQEYKTFYNNEKCIKTAKNVQNSENGNNTLNNNSINQKVIAQNNANIINNKDHNNTAIIKNAVGEANVPGRKVQDDKHETNKEECNAKEGLQKNKRNDLQNKNTDEHSCDFINTKGWQYTILKLEERLYNYSGSKYSINSLIHTGRFSKMFKCKHPNGKYYALKMLTSTKYNVGTEKKDMLFSLISDIPKNNLFIVNLVRAFNLGENNCFLMEYYPKNLQQALDENGKPFSIDLIQDFARQLVMAVMVLKNKKMVHLDINPKHILINSSNNMLKLCGFDNLSYVNKMKVLPNVGTVNYRAPEVILGYESGFEIDVWSTGLVLYEMAANDKLFPGAFNNDILFKQICTLGCIPDDMLIKSRYSGLHFVGSKFKKRSGFKGQTINVVSKFYKNNKLCDSIYQMYYENWDRNRSVYQQSRDIGKISLLVKVLQKMLNMHPESRLPIEFVYANPFIYDAYSFVSVKL